MRHAAKALLPLLLLCLAMAARAQQSEMFGPFELHYSVVNTTFLAPETASAYGLVRSKERALLNLAVREHLADGTSAGRAMELRGRTRDLLQQGEELDFIEVREGGAIYYLAEFKFINEEWRFFEVDFRPQGAEQTYHFSLKQQLYRDE